MLEICWIPANEVFRGIMPRPVRIMHWLAKNKNNDRRGHFQLVYPTTHTLRSYWESLVIPEVPLGDTPTTRLMPAIPSVAITHLLASLVESRHKAMQSLTSQLPCGTLHDHCAARDCCWPLTKHLEAHDESLWPVLVCCAPLCAC